MKRGFINSAHDVSEGGLLTAVAEMSMGTHGISLKMTRATTEELFGEGPGMVVFTASSANMSEVEKLIPGLKRIGTTTTAPGLKLQTDTENFDWDVETLRRAHKGLKK